MIGRRGFIGSALAAATSLLLPVKAKPKFEITPVSTVKGVFLVEPPAQAATLSDAFIPEQWARESLKVLEENMVVANLIHRDVDQHDYDWSARLGHLRRDSGGEHPS